MNSAILYFKLGDCACNYNCDIEIRYDNKSIRVPVEDVCINNNKVLIWGKDNKHIIKNNAITIKRTAAKKFIESSNKNKISNDFLEECKNASKLFKTVLTVKQIIDNVIINDIPITLYKYDNENNKIKLWQGMPLQLPEEYNNKYGKIFIMPLKSNNEDDTINIILIN